eukprot:SAG11_NODE_7127_length_1189_cov_1.339450_2_plen_353_part_01
MHHAVAAILFWLFGYTVAFGEDQGGFMGWGTWTDDGEGGWLVGSDDYFAPQEGSGMPYNGNAYASWFFQWAFAATASTIVSGAVAERVNFVVYMIITTFLTAFIYPVVVHWQWGGGWAGTWGVLDFAGSGVVHMTGGISALVCVLFVGPRHGKFVTQKALKEDPVQENGEHWYVKSSELPLPDILREQDFWCEITLGETWTPSTGGEAVAGQTWRRLAPPRKAGWKKALDEDEVLRLEKKDAVDEETKAALDGDGGVTRRFSNTLPASSAPFQTLGCFILWFGWYGFNCASTLGISGDFGGQAAKVAVTTTLGAAAGALVSGIVHRISDGYLDLSAMSNGILAGLVAVTAPCA